MASNSEQLVPHMHAAFQTLIDYVTAAESRTRTASAVELTLFRRLLALGAALLRRFFRTRAAVRPAAPSTPSGMALPDHDQRAIDYSSIFGKLACSRHYVSAAGVGGDCRLDTALSLPERGYSDLLRDWVGYESTDSAYRASRSTVSRLLGLDLRVAALETRIRADARAVAACYDRPVSAATALGTILVVQADGKGVPMVQPPSTAAPVRLGNGQQRTKQQEAIVTARYPSAPYHRTPQDGLAALLHAQRPAEQPPRPQPVQTEWRATLAGKAAASATRAERAALREAPTSRIAWC